MPIDLPESAAEVVARSKADVQRELPESDPFLKNNWLYAHVTAAANRIFDFYVQLRAAIRESFPDTAVQFLERWAAIWGKQRLAATQARGRVVATGTATSSIPDASVLTVAGVGTYTTQGASVVSAQSIGVTAFVRSGQTVTATTSGPHGLANNVSPTITGASNAEYNGTFAITVTAADQFEYTIIGTPPDEPGASALASFTIASVTVQSDDFGAAANLDAGVELRLQSPLVGVDDTLAVDFDAVGGGADQESLDDLRTRLLERIQNPVALFNVAAITEKAREVAGVTRVFVQEVTPAVGQVTIYFMRDNDNPPIPDGSEVAAVKSAILEIKPANTADADVIVLAPSAVPIPFTFSTLSPDTATMRAAITANLEQFFAESVAVGSNVTEDAYRAAIYSTVDTETGAANPVFSLSTPIGDVAVAAGEIGTLGAIIYP